MPEMTLAKAREITAACVRSKYSAMGIFADEQSEEYVPLPDVSLEEMLAANRIVEAAGATPEDGGRSLQIVIDPRGLAALYTREHYHHSPEDALAAMGWQLIQDDEDE